MEKTVNKRNAQALGLLAAAVTITVFSMMFPAAFTYGGYNGIIYHGFPAGWMGHTTQGILSITEASNSLQYFNYIIGFIIDIAFWFCVAFILFTISQLDVAKRLR
jgi:hypothetical protein